MSFYQAQLAKHCNNALCLNASSRLRLSLRGAEIEHSFVLIVGKVVPRCVHLHVNLRYGPAVLQRSLICWWSLKKECLLIQRRCRIVSSASTAFSRRISNRYSLPSPVLSPACTFSHATLEYLGFEVSVSITLP